MDTFEKQQRIDSIRGLVKARWFAIVIVVGLGFILKIKYFGWAPKFDPLLVLSFGAFFSSYNFIYWLFISRPIERINEKWLAIVAALQVVLDQILFTILFYYAGTVETINFVLYFITILIASSLYKAKGVILAGLMAVILFCGVVIIEFYGLITHVFPYEGTIFFGNLGMTRSRVISFAAYIAVAVVFSIILSGLFRKRESSIRQQRDQLSGQTQILTTQTQELTKTKDYLHEALTKSDAARVEIGKTKTELEKANLELQAKLRELEKYGQVTIGRELKMIELKDKIKTLEKRIEELEKK